MEFSPLTDTVTCCSDRVQEGGEVELATHHSKLLPFLGRTEVGEDLEPRTPLLELKLPVKQDGGGNHNEVWPPHALLTGHVGQHGYSLDGLSQAHLVRKNAIEFPLVHHYQPLQADVLVVSQLVAEEEGDWGADLEGWGGGGVRAACRG